MPGLFGIVGNLDSSILNRLLAEMAKALKDQDWYPVDLHQGEGYGLGRASTGILNSEPQPVWNEDKTLCLVMEGEIFDYQEKKKRLIELGYKFYGDNQAEFILHLYEEYGEEFSSHLNGAFVVGIWDIRKKKLILSNDHLGLRPLYYAHYQGRFSFASGVRALLADPLLPRNIDRIAIAQMMCFEYVLEDRTLLEGVKLLPPASILVYQDSQINIHYYWRAHYSEFNQNFTVEEYLEGLIYYLRQAAIKQAPGDIPAGVNLSGGLDSRMVVSLLREVLPKELLYTFTFGIPGCDDARISKEIASLVKTKHRFYELTPTYLIEVVEEGIRLTDGMESCIHIHALSNLKDQAKCVHILYTGFFIDYLFSPDFSRSFWANYDSETVYRILFNQINTPALFRHPDQENLFSKDFLRQVDGAFDDSFQSVVLDAKATQVANWLDNLDLYQRRLRFTQNGDELIRSQAICRTIFTDKNLVEFALTVPPGLRLDRFLFQQALARMNNELAKVPWAKTGYPITPCFRELGLRFQQQFRWALKSKGIPWVDLRRPRPYTDYNNWMRNSLRPWVEGTLLNKHCLERGYFNPDSIKNLVTEHMAGADYASKLGVLLTLELWHKKYLD